MHTAEFFWPNFGRKGSHHLALFRSLCDKRQLSRKNKFDKLSGIIPALVFCRILSPKLCIMQGFGAQTHLFSEVTRPQQFERPKKKKVSNGPQKVTDPIFVNRVGEFWPFHDTPFVDTPFGPPRVNPPPEGLLNNTNTSRDGCFLLTKAPRKRRTGNASRKRGHCHKNQAAQLPCMAAAALSPLEAQQRYFSYRAILAAIVLGPS